MAPVDASRVRPAGNAVYVPPVVPVRVTDCAVTTEVQNGVPAYDMVPVTGAAVIVTDAVVDTPEHPPAAAIV